MWNGSLFSTLDDYNVTSLVEGCQTTNGLAPIGLNNGTGRLTFLALPSNWAVAVGRGNVSFDVVGNYGWGTNGLMVADNSYYRTLGSKSRYGYDNGTLGNITINGVAAIIVRLENNSLGVSVCYLRILVEHVGCPAGTVLSTVCNVSSNSHCIVQTPPPPGPLDPFCSMSEMAASLSSCPLKAAKNVTGYWINKDNPGFASGNVNQHPVDVDFIFLGSYDPDPLTGGCSAASASYSLAPFGNTNGLTLARSIRMVTRNLKARIILSVGGSSYGAPNFCALVLPFIQLTNPEIRNCSQVTGNSGDLNKQSCHSHNAGLATRAQEKGQEPSFGGVVCGASANNSRGVPSEGPFVNDFTYPASNNNTNSPFTCQFTNGTTNLLCLCCCNYNYVFNATMQAQGLDPCVLSGPAPVPANVTNCGKWAGAATNATLMIDFLFEILTKAQIDGLDFDFESSDDNGYLALGLVVMAKMLKMRFVGSGYNMPYFTATLMSGPTYGDGDLTLTTPSTNGLVHSSYVPLYKSFHCPDSPFDAAVPMLYDNCGYFWADMPNYATETYNNVTGQWSPGPALSSLAANGETIDQLLGAWMERYMGCTNTALVPALTNIQHWDRYPCEFGTGDIGRFVGYLNQSNSSLKTPSGAFWWYFPSNDYLPAGYADEYNNSRTLEVVSAWQAAVPTTATVYNWPPLPSPNCSGVSGTSKNTRLKVVGVWVNVDDVLSFGPGTSLANVPLGTDLVMIASFPVSIAENCEVGDTLFAGGLFNGSLSYVGAMKNSLAYLNRAKKFKILASIGGSTPTTADWCELLIPFVAEKYSQYPDCTTLLAGGAGGSAAGGLCQDANAFVGAAGTCWNDGAAFNGTMADGVATACCCDSGYLFNGTVFKCLLPVSPFGTGGAQCNSNFGRVDYSNNLTVVVTGQCPSTPYGTFKAGYNFTYNSIANASTSLGFPGWPSNVWPCCCPSWLVNCTFNATALALGEDACSNCGASSGGGVTPAAPVCGTYGTGKNLTSNMTVDILYGILIGNNLDGFDFDFELKSPDDKSGLLAEALLELMERLKGRFQVNGLPLPVFVVDLFAGFGTRGEPGDAVPPVFESSSMYTPIFDCLHTTTCVIDYVVPMLYDDCMYQLSSTAVFSQNCTKSGDFSSCTATAKTAGNLNNGGFTLDGLWPYWSSYFMGCTNTILVAGLTTDVTGTGAFTSRDPCGFQVGDIPFLKSSYGVASGVANPMQGAFFWWLFDVTGGGGGTGTSYNNVTVATMESWIGAF